MFFKRIKFIRRVKTDILFQNLSAIILIVVLIITYTYLSNSRSTIEQAEDYIRTSTNFIGQKIVKSLDISEDFVNSYTALLQNMDLKNYENNVMIYKSLQVILESNPYLTHFLYATPDGLFVSSCNLRYFGKFLKSSAILIPEGANGVIMVIPRDKTENKIEVPELWYFLKENDQLSESISTQLTKYDSRNRPWYKESAKTQSLVWSDIYKFSGTLSGEVGMTVSKSIMAADGVMKGVFAATITLKSFSEFLAEFKPSANGNIYIVDQEDRIVASSNNYKIHSSENHLGIVKIDESRFDELKAAFAAFKSKKDKGNFTIFEMDNKEYLSLKMDFPKKLPCGLSMMVVAPLDDFVGAIKQMRQNHFYLIFLIGFLAAVSSYLLSRSISGPITQLSIEANKIKDLDFGESPVIHTKIQEIKELSAAITALKTSVQSFSYYIPKTMMKRLMQRKQTIHMGGRKKEVTLFFSDIEGFTAVSESMNAEHLSVHLCDYFDALGNIIAQHEGTIDKFIGDSIMAFWGAPIADRYHSKHACNTALLCQKKLSELNRIWKREGKPQLKTRMGIHTGDVIIGNIGSSERMNYTAMGDNVNLCSRLESINKVYGTKIIISETVLGELKNHFYVRSLDNVVVKGKTKPLKIYELVGIQNDDHALLPSDETLSFNEHFEQAYHLYLTRQFEEASRKFKEINETVKTNDLSVLMYIDRCKEFMKNPPPKEWDGTFFLEHK